MNGSSSNGECSDVVNGSVCGNLSDGGTSDLIDRNVPYLETLQDDWAAGLFTVNRSGQSSFYIGFKLHGYFNLTKVELDLFNCPEWGIAAPSITVYTHSSFNFDRDAAKNLSLGNTTDAATSCNSTVTVCIPLQLPQNQQRIYIIDFTFKNTHDNIQWVHIAEVRFSEGDQLCPNTTGIYYLHINKNQHTPLFSLIVHPEFSQSILVLHLPIQNEYSHIKYDHRFW